jgi:hypothetical protein
MSDTEDLEVPAEPLKPEKKKKVMTEEMLEKLKVAREKAAQVKRAAKLEKDKVQQDLVAKEKEKRLAKMKDKVEKQYIDLDEKPAPKEPLEEQLEVIKKPKKPKKKVVIMHNSSDSDSDSDSQTQVIYIPKKKSNKSKEPKEVAPPPPPQPHQFGYNPKLKNFNAFY